MNMRHFKSVDVDRHNCTTLSLRAGVEALMRLEAYMGDELAQDEAYQEFRKQYAVDVANIVFGDVVFPLVTKMQVAEDGAVSFDIDLPDMERTEQPVFYREAHRLEWLCDKITGFIEMYHELYDFEERHVLGLIASSREALENENDEVILRNRKELEQWLPHVQVGARFFRGDPVARARYEEWRENLPEEFLQRFEEEQERWHKVEAVAAGAYGDDSEYRSAIRKLEDREEALMRELGEVQSRLKEVSEKVR